MVSDSKEIRELQLAIAQITGALVQVYGALIGLNRNVPAAYHDEKFRGTMEDFSKRIDELLEKVKTMA